MRAIPQRLSVCWVRQVHAVAVVMGLQFPKPLPRAVTKHRKRIKADAALQEAYADVDARDAGICWVTGRWTAPYGSERAVDPRVRREHHHLKGRNVKPEWVTDPRRIITVCAEAHGLITQGWIVVEGCDARKPIFFHWRSDVKANLRPFVIKGRRSAHGDD